jgi:predicted RNA-binding protein with PIN domain
MRIIIDGYNYIRQTDLRGFENISLERGRNELIKRLSIYKKAKGHKITIVFDGILSESLSEQRDRSAGVSIIYSRRGETADEVIKRIIRSSSEELLIVSSDREIAFAAEQHGFTAVNSQTFAHKVAEADFRFDSSGSIEKDDYSSKREKKGPSKRMPRRKRVEQKNIKKL